MKTAFNLVGALVVTAWGSLSLIGNTWNTPDTYADGDPGFSAFAESTITDNYTKLRLEGWVECHNYQGNGARGYYYPTKTGPHQWGHWAVTNTDFVDYGADLDAAPYRNTCIAYCSLVDSESQASAYCAE